MSQLQIVTYSVVLNQHQAPVADELWELTGHQFAFVELIAKGSTKGGVEDYSTRPYLLRAWESPENWAKAMELARTAECCIFSGVDSLPFQKERMKLGLFSFDMSERWLKLGWKSLGSPRLLKWLAAYYLGGWKHKPLYKLCMSSFAAHDHYRMGTFRGKAYKWGYFTTVEAGSKEFHVQGAPVRLMWCARFIDWKHPEMAIECARRLKANGYDFHLDMYGDGVLRNECELKVAELGLRDSVTIHGNVPNNIVREAMSKADIFLFTSDRYEGWGAVANESLSCGCVLVASDEIGSAPYLVNDGENGFLFKSCDAESLTEKVEWLLNHPAEMAEMQQCAVKSMQQMWNPRHAAESLIQLIDDLKNGRESSISEGPCSKA